MYTIKSSLYGFHGNMHDCHVYKSKGGDLFYDEGIHENCFENYVKIYHGEEDLLMKILETRRVLRLMDAVRECSQT